MGSQARDENVRKGIDLSGVGKGMSKGPRQKRWLRTRNVAGAEQLRAEKPEGRRQRIRHRRVSDHTFRNVTVWRHVLPK